MRLFTTMNGDTSNDPAATANVGDNNNSGTATAVDMMQYPQHEKGQYSIDIRVFLAVITIAMSIAFGLGVAIPISEYENALINDASNLIFNEKQQGQSQSLDVGHHVNYETPSLEGIGPGVVSKDEKQQEPTKTSTTKEDNNTTGEEGEEKQQEQEEEHLPAGQHLLVDIKGVSSEFLSSEELLVKAMIGAVRAGGLTLLSYHCHALENDEGPDRERKQIYSNGISCVGVLLESHISFHTWPSEGVITIDLFTCGPTPLIPTIPVIEELFGISDDPDNKKVKVQWAHELRGFRDYNSGSNNEIITTTNEDGTKETKIVKKKKKKSHYLDNQSDLVFYVLGTLDMYKKEKIVSIESEYQQIDIWDVLDIDNTPSYEDGLKHNLSINDPRWLTPELATPIRYLFLDGNLQSNTDSEHEYHESLVHPAMFTHSHPKNVVIVGGGEGGTLREVLKHKTVESVKMIDIDKLLIDLSKEHLPTMSNCSDLVGRADSCFDDELATIIYEDGRRYFIDHYGPAADNKNSPQDDPQEEEEPPVDVIIIDALDPEDEIEISDELYSDVNFLQSLMNSLSDDGVIVIQVGTAPNILDPKPDIGVYSSREYLFNTFESLPDVASMFVYEEAHCGFMEPHSFLIVCKNVNCRKNWYKQSDAIDYEIYERIVHTNSKKRPLIHYDGTTQVSFQIPPKAWETVYCRREPMPFECQYRGLDLSKDIYEFDLKNKSNNAFRIETNDNNYNPNSTNYDEQQWTYVYATKDIPAGSYIMPSHLASSLLISDISIANLQKNTILGNTPETGRVTVIEDLLNFIDYYGHKSLAEGSNDNYVEIGVTYMIRTLNETTTEKPNIGRWVPNHPNGGKRPTYSPVYERRRRSFDLFLIATKDIKKGDELLKPIDLWE